MEILQFNNLNVVIERKSFRRSLSVYVYPDRPVTVRASRLASKKLILDFLELKKDWIEKHYMRVMSQKKMFPQRKIQSGQAFPFLGTNLILKPVITLQKKFFFSKTETELFLHIPRNDWGQKVTTENFGYLSPQIRKFYKQESILYLSSRVEHFSLLMKLKPELLRWTEARTR